MKRHRPTHGLNHPRGGHGQNDNGETRDCSITLSIALPLARAAG
jgi:hypothetical protein